MKHKAKILLLDIETAPAKVYSWGLYDQNIPINHIIQTGHVICWCAKWLGEKKVLSGAYTKDSKSNYLKMLQEVWNLLDEADIVVTHNGNYFDLRWLNLVFLEHGFKPVSPFKSIDTKSEAQKNIYALSNKLDYLGQKLEIGGKMGTGGFDLWKGCMAFKPASINKMVKYCKQDVLLLERLYLKLRPFIRNHPNLTIYSGEDLACVNCGSNKLVSKGLAYTANNVYRRYTCSACGKCMRGKKSLTGSNIRSYNG